MWHHFWASPFFRSSCHCPVSPLSLFSHQFLWLNSQICAGTPVFAVVRGLLFNYRVTVWNSILTLIVSEVSFSLLLSPVLPCGAILSLTYASPFLCVH
jgi:hypothetical protein